MTEDYVAKILAQLADHEARLKKLESGQSGAPAQRPSVGGKQKTLRELVKGKKFNNGQEQVAAIVGYHELVLGQRIPKNQIKEEWADSKMKGAYAPVYLSRANGVLIRVHTDDDSCDLTQTGEEFFDKILNNESADTSS